MAFVLNIINPNARFGLADPAMLAQLRKSDETKNEEARKAEEKREESTDESSQDKQQVAKKPAPSLTQAQIVAQKNRLTAIKFNQQAHEELERSYKPLNELLQEAIKANLIPQQTVADIQRADKAQFNQGLTNFAASEVYKLYDDPKFKSKFKFGQDVFNAAKLVIGVIKEKGDFKLDYIDANAEGSREAFDVFKDEEKSKQLALLLQYATDHFMDETSKLLSSPLKKDQANAQAALDIAKAVLQAENRIRAQMLYTQSLGVKNISHITTA
ncbi:MAG: hypothetical protein A3B68_00590 [Candidatus Melainabacteria bacterium RIFCSPHIGHO2_02_FULL_34_12]|nr:MAG: hypothetical protein A3B68_00590 [Candidatus Melainabacteria bacterium RIFCSPHIGHO2_02_FULL_34_12]